MTTFPSLLFSINTWNPLQRPKCYLLPKSPNPIKILCLKSTKFGAIHQSRAKRETWEKGFLRMNKDGILWRGEKRVVKVRFRSDSNTGRVLGNLALAVGLTYLTLTGNLGWILDAIVSLWLLAFIIPIVGIGAFLWWAGRDMIQSTCPNCGNAFQVFKSSLNGEPQLCPFCSQPFSVEGNEFVNERIKFSSKGSAPFGQTIDDFSPWSKKRKEDTRTTIVDIEAEVKDAD